MPSTVVTNVNGIRVAYSEAGAGAPVVLLHSSASSKSQWRTLTAALEDRFHLMAPDLYGYGETDPWTGRRPLTLSDEAALVTPILTRCPEPVHLVGHSYGGAVALRVALEHADRVRSLTLIEPVAFHLLQIGHTGDRPLWDEIQAVAETVWQTVARGDYWGGMARFVDYWNGPGAWAALQESHRQKLAPLIVKVAQDFAATFRETALLDAYRQIAMPTLVLCGDRSPAPTQRIARLLAGTLPTSQFERIPSAGHMAPLTHAAVVNAEVTDHLADATPCAATAAGIPAALGATSAPITRPSV